MLGVINCIPLPSNQSIPILWRSHRRYYRFQSAKDLLQEKTFFNLIEAEFKAHKIPWENCLALGADNAPVMVGRDKGVYGHMSRKNPSIFMAGCVCHLIHIAAEKGAACLPLDVSQLLIDAYYYLDKSNLSSKKCSFSMMKHVSTRWLSIKKCLPRLIENSEHLYTFFLNQKSQHQPQPLPKRRQGG